MQTQQLQFDRVNYPYVVSGGTNLDHGTSYSHLRLTKVLHYQQGRANYTKCNTWLFPILNELSSQSTEGHTTHVLYNCGTK